MSRASWLNWLWPLIIIFSAAGAGLVTFVFPATVLRPALVMWFLFVCPGMAVVRFFRLAETAIEWTLALALSFAIDACIAAIFLYAGKWSPSRILGVLIGFCLFGALIQLVVACANAASFALKQTRVKHAEHTQNDG
jgi:hypothetical protein